MIHLIQNEEILMTLHRHWIAVLGKFLLSILLLILAIVATPYFPKLEAVTGVSQMVFWFLTLIYLMIIILLTFMFWVEYYLDIWIITSERIIDVRQKGLFNREVSEFLLSKVQDVTVDVPNITATLLKYGNILVHTGEGSMSFKIEQIPRVYEAKNLILDYSRKNNVGAQQVGANKI